jgi:hypothetical protein
MSLAVILSLVGTLAAASIAAGVALYIKRVERWNAAELRHSEAREKAYDSYLAACDRAWHLRAKQAIDRQLNPDRVISSEKFNEIADTVGQRTLSALEDLQRHASNYERAAPTLLRLYHLAFEQNPPNVPGFEDARISVQELRREEEGLRKTLRRARKASPLRELKARREVHRIMRNVTAFQAVYPNGDEALVYQDVGDGEGILYLLKQNMREWTDLQEAVTRQEARSGRWKSMGLWPE